jgi:SAM-dependent methyltransferase
VSVFGAYAAYYDVLNAGKDYAGEAAYVERLLRRANCGPDLLELGCGTGMHASLLAERGFRVCGVDRSMAMLSSATERAARMPADVASRLSFRRGDVRSFRAATSFDGVISLFHVMSYQTTQDDLESAMETARAHLKPGGVFVFDCWYGPAVLSERPERRVRQFENDVVAVTRIAEPVMHPNDNVVDVNFHVTVKQKATGAEETISESHRMRYLFVPEVRASLQRQSLTLVEHQEWMTGRPAGFDTWSVTFVARAV